MKVRIRDHRVPWNLSADGLDDRVTLSQRPCQDKGCVIQVFTQNDRNIIYSKIRAWMRACVRALTSLPMELISGKRLLNSAPASLRFDQWENVAAEWQPSVGTDPAVGSLCGGRKWKDKKTFSALCVCVDAWPPCTCWYLQCPLVHSPDRHGNCVFVCTFSFLLPLRLKKRKEEVPFRLNL